MGKLHNVTSGILSKVREYNLPYYKMVTNLTFYATIKGSIMSDYTHFAAYIFYSGCVSLCLSVLNFTAEFSGGNIVKSRGMF